MDKTRPNIFDPFHALVMQKLIMEATDGLVKGVLLIGGKSLLEILKGSDYSRAELESLVQHIDDSRPHLQYAFRHVAIWNIKTGFTLEALIEAGYVREPLPSSTKVMIDVLTRVAGAEYTFAGVNAEINKALRQDEASLKAGGAGHSSIWAERKWEWREYER